MFFQKHTYVFSETYLCFFKNTPMFFQKHTYDFSETHVCFFRNIPMIFRALPACVLTRSDSAISTPHPVLPPVAGWLLDVPTARISESISLAGFAGASFLGAPWPLFVYGQKNPRRRATPTRRAESEGFEPPDQLPGHRISSAARSTTPATFQLSPRPFGGARRMRKHGEEM